MNKSPRIKRVITIFALMLLLALLSGGGYALRYYHTFYRPNILSEEETLDVYVPTGASFATLMDSLDAKGYLRFRNAFVRAAHKEQLPDRVKGGRYQLVSGMNNKAAVRLFALGLQTPVNMVISGNIRSVERLAAVLSRSIEADSLSMLLSLTDDLLLARFGFDSTSLFSMILPNTYEVYWNTSPEKVLERMHREVQKWWNEERQDLAKAVGLSPFQVSTLAAIVQGETNYQPEMPTVAGVYMNRLKIGMPLQADPTLIFALRDPTIRRLYSRDTQVDSPYNTYKYKGLPPGPICVPSIAALEAVLHYQKHNYLYFCANPEFNGSHLFAVNYSDHLRNARAYQRAANERGIKR